MNYYIKGSFSVNKSWTEKAENEYWDKCCQYISMTWEANEKKSGEKIDKRSFDIKSIILPFRTWDMMSDRILKMLFFLFIVAVQMLLGICR